MLRGGQHQLPSDPRIPVAAWALQDLGWLLSPPASGSQEGLSVGGRACVRRSGARPGGSFTLGKVCKPSC